MTEKFVDSVEKLYKIYTSASSFIPEDYLMRTGEYILDKLPLYPFRLLRTEVKDKRLETNLAEIKLDNPLILASCYLGKGILEKAMYLGFGAVTTKSIRKNPNEGNPGIKVVRRGKGIVNSVGLKGPGYKKYRNVLDEIDAIKPVISSIAVESIGDTVEIVKYYSDSKSAGFELNISCPNITDGRVFNENPELVYNLAKAVTSEAKKPIILKISPDFEDITSEIVGAAIKGGISIINIGNTKKVKEPRLPKGEGGLSGPELFECTKRMTGEIYKDCGNKIQIISTGGITTGENGVDLIKSGSSALGILTALITEGPTIFYRINKYILEEIENKKFKSVREMVGYSA